MLAMVSKKTRSSEFAKTIKGEKKRCAHQTDPVSVVLSPSEKRATKYLSPVTSVSCGVVNGVPVDLENKTKGEGLDRNLSRKA